MNLREPILVRARPLWEGGMVFLKKLPHLAGCNVGQRRPSKPAPSSPRCRQHKGRVAEVASASASAVAASASRLARATLDQLRSLDSPRKICLWSIGQACDEAPSSTLAVQTFGALRRYTRVLEALRCVGRPPVIGKRQRVLGLPWPEFTGNARTRKRSSLLCPHGSGIARGQSPNPEIHRSPIQQCTNS